MDRLMDYAGRSLLRAAAWLPGRGPLARQPEHTHSLLRARRSCATMKRWDALAEPRPPNVMHQEGGLSAFLADGRKDEDGPFRPRNPGSVRQEIGF